MNTRIIELAEQCGFNYNENFGLTADIGADAEKFAELIISECMSVADLPNDVSGKWDHLLPSEMIAEHFGVE